MHKAVNEMEAAIFLGLAPQTLRNWRHQRRGPPYLKLGRSVRYDVPDLLEFIRQRRITPETVCDRIDPKDERVLNNNL